MDAARDDQDRRILGALKRTVRAELARDGSVLPRVPLAIDKDEARRLARAVPPASVLVGVLDRLALCAAEGAWRGEVEAALALPVLCGNEARDDGRCALGGTVLPEGKARVVMLGLEDRH